MKVMYLQLEWNCNYPPFNWQTNTQSDTAVELEGSGYADGYDVYIAKEIAESLDKKLVIKNQHGMVCNLHLNQAKQMPLLQE